ncbi:MAG: hypothetical protein EAZ36_02345 [Verrucomicrobia bacterium]|nr:MAG: hypothetical protein EAZ36_02345 [Verrucomicrobiota bacterium]
MSLTSEQKATVSAWIAAGDNLSAVQKKLREQFQVSMTYMDVRFLVDDLNLTLRDPAPKADTSDVTKAKVPAPAKAAPAPAAPAKKGLLDKAKEKLGLAKADATAQDPSEGEESASDLDGLEEDALPPVPGNVSVELDALTLKPGAIASGSVTFSDGVTGKWIVDQYGRPGFTEISQPGYRPSPEDGQAFMQELDAALRQKGF